jgi:flavin-dependent dehydrogenase
MARLARDQPEQNFAVAVIGGGPAGSTCGMLLARAGISTTIIESSEGIRWKIGEGLPPLAKPLLRKLGLWERFLKDEHLVSYGNTSAWGSPDLVDHSFVFDPNGNGWHLDRCKFDEMLLSAAEESGAVLRRGTTVTSWSKTRAEDWKLLLTGRNGQRSEIAARFVVDATGRKRWFARRQGVKEIEYDSLMGWVSLLSPEGPAADKDSLTLVEAVEKGWWYLALIPGGKLVVAFLSDSDLGLIRQSRQPPLWMELLKETTHVSRRVARFGYRIEIGPRAIEVNSSCVNPTTGNAWLAVGDAAAAFDPLSSQGILTAMEAAMHAATAIVQCLQGQGNSLQHYVLEMGEVLSSYLARRYFYYSKERRWYHSPFWRRRTPQT